ncbi:MAG: YIP1 family protein [Methanomicrobiales archaeon]|nr:YIP1 family protein [Methanomicrobiales archaeon]
MVSSILLLFTDPDGFFRRDPKEWSGLKTPAVIVLVAGIIGAVSAYLVSRTILQIFPENLQSATGLVAIAGVVGAIVGIFFAWVAYTIVLHVISMLFMGKGTFAGTLAAVGYGFLPTAIGSLIDLILFAYYLPTLQMAPVKDVLDIQSATLALTHSPVFQMVSLIGVIFLLWSANIWVYGLRYARRISLRHAAITVAIPVVVLILVTLVTSGFFS